jgi:hypothetical protein
MGPLVMFKRGRRSWPWLVGALATAMALASVPLLVTDWWTFRPGPVEPIWVTATVQVVAPIWTVLMLSVLTGFILSRRPRSPLGWAFATSALLLASTLLMQEYAVRALYAAPGSLPAGEVAAWIGAWASPGTGLLLFPLGLAVLLFPDGRLPGRSWWLAAGLALLTTAGNLIEGLAGPWMLGLPMRAGGVPVTMPPALWEVGSVLAGWPAEALGWANLLLVPVIAVLLLLRTRRARGDERFQLRWLTYALAIAAVCWIGWYLTDARVSPWASDANAHVISRWGQLGAIFTGLVVVPGAMAIAIFKYRLYDIDILINRTLVYGAITATLGATYWTTVLGLQGLLSSLTVGSEFAVALSTLLVAALFHPIRRRAQDAVDRRFYRARYDATRAVDAFVERLRQDVELNSVRADLLEVVNSTVKPGHASVWFRAGRG